MLNFSNAINLIQSNITQYGGAILIIISALVVVGVGYLAFKFGWHRMKIIFTDGIERNSFGVGPLEQMKIEKEVDDRLRGRF